MNYQDLLLQWNSEPRTQRRGVIERDGAAWAIPAEGDSVRWPARPERFAHLQEQYFPLPDLSQNEPLPPSSIIIIRSDAHPIVLYETAMQMIVATTELKRPPAITIGKIAEKFPMFGGPAWLEEVDDGDFADFAMDAAGYDWTQHKIGRGKRNHYIYVRRDLSPTQRDAAIRELKAGAR